MLYQLSYARVTVSRLFATTYECFSYLTDTTQKWYYFPIIFPLFPHDHGTLTENLPLFKTLA